MQQKLFTITTWLNEDPNRMRAISMGIAVAMALLVLIFPEAAALADPEATAGS